jgi:hypothetical protein
MNKHSNNEEQEFKTGYLKGRVIAAGRG